MTENVPLGSVPGELIRFIKSGTNFVIAGHKEPDGDCIGSQLALRSVLRRLGKKVVICSAGPFVRPDIKKIKDEFSPVPKDNIENTRLIVVDCSNMDRTGDIEEDLKKFQYAVIDHHISTSHPPSSEETPVFIDPSSPSCTLLIERVIISLGMELTDEEAHYLLFGLCTDTGFFRHLTEQSSKVFEAASRMIDRGASPKKCFSIMNGGKSLKSRILIGNILSRTESFYDGRLLISYETQEDFINFGLESRDSDTLNQLLLSVEGVEATAVIREEEIGNCNVSLRSVDKIDVAKIAFGLGGGGHKNAAGLTMQGNISFVKEKIIETFNDFFI